MNKRRLGDGGYEIGEVGVGCWQFGGDFGVMAEDTAFEVLEAAVASGIDFFDTADVYGPHTSERLIGRFLSGRDTDADADARVIVATKYGRASNVYPNHYTEDTLRRCVDGSLERLGVDCLDLLQLHCVPIAVLRQGEIFDWLRSVQEEGLIRQFGASVETVEEGLLCMEQSDLQSLQVIFNVFRQKLATDLLPQAKAKGVGIIVRLPLASGLLAGKFTKDTTFEKGDHRNYNRDGAAFSVGETFAGLPFEKGVELADEVKQLVPDGMTMAQMTQRWILDHDAVSTIITGASSPRQVRENAAVSELPRLSGEVHRKLAKLYVETVHEHVRGPY